MSSPFGNPFGNQQNTPVFGGTTSQQGSFGTPSVFGQQSVFGQTTTASAFPSPGAVSTGNIFGQAQTLTTGTQPSLFSSQVAPPPSYASSVFGQSSGFGQGSLLGQSSASGQNSGGIGSSVFSRPAATGSVGTQNVFGGTAFGGGSNFSNTNSSGLFGNPGQSLAFQKSTPLTSSSFGQPTTQSSLFSSAFGQVRSGNVKPEVSSTAPSLFGGLATVKSEPPSTISPSAGLFGKPSAVPVNNAAAPNLFGKATDSASSSLATSNLFGKSTSASTGSVFAKAEKVDDVKPQLFGAGYLTNTAGNLDTKPTGLFGKVKQENIAESGETKTEPSTLFVGNRIKQENLSAGTAGSDKAQGTGLFGKGKPETTGNKYKGLFGKRKSESIDGKDTGLFGKGKALNQTLFRNPVKEEDERKGFGGGAGYSQESEDENPLQQHSGGGGSRSAARGLFGKPVQKGETSGTGLFGKTAVSRARAPSSSDDKDESKPSFRRQISEEISSKVAIICRNVPHKYNTAMHLRSHFKRFGEVTKVFPNQAKMQATVHFKTHDAAAEAKRRGRVLARGVLPMTIFWSSYTGTPTPKATKSSPDMDAKPTRPVKRTSDMMLSRKTIWRFASAPVSLLLVSRALGLRQSSRTFTGADMGWTIIQEEDNSLYLATDDGKKLRDQKSVEFGPLSSVAGGRTAGEIWFKFKNNAKGKRMLRSLFTASSKFAKETKLDTNVSNSEFVRILTEYGMDRIGKKSGTAGSTKSSTKWPACDGDIQPHYTTVCQELQILKSKCAGVFTVPVEKVLPALPAFAVRDIDKEWVQEIKRELLEAPFRPVTRIPILLDRHEIESTDSFQEDMLKKTNMYALGGNHLVQAIKDVITQNPGNDNFKCLRQVDIEVYCGLSNIEARYLGSLHNSQCKTKAITFQDKVRNCRMIYQTFKDSTEINWKDVCAKSMGIIASKEISKEGLGLILSVAAYGEANFDMTNEMFRNFESKQKTGTSFPQNLFRSLQGVADAQRTPFLTAAVGTNGLKQARHAATACKERLLQQVLAKGLGMTVDEALEVYPDEMEEVKRFSADLLPRSKKPSWKGSETVDEELENMAGTQDVKGRVKELMRSPEKRSRSVSPTPSTSSSLDIKPEKITIGMFEGCVARTTTEQVNLLRLRDKYIRQNRAKGKKDMVKAFVGTCPDMCPEKERYDREDKRQLSYYEIIPGTENIPGRNPQVDHSRAVKEYLRSSPDQDEPLPYELRPIPVLQSTMTYLLREVADRGEDGRWGDWFDFLWNRTRGIRKDIIQQQLNDRHAVDLIEKCARFHIYCSERLCEEDMHSFDAKINNENLTKCLQTLKEFYTDLEKKHKCYCENEAEFRAYMVLMNLNQGDILREVQQLRPEIRTSPAIKFALNAYFALNGNNYIKFFRLLKQASFSNACILHRYFTQVRNRALTLMMRGYSMGNRSAQIPVTELARLLGFESDSEASDFSQHYGFNVSDGEVVLDKAEYIEPDTAWLPVRSVTLIESKLMVTAGEFINGGTFRETTRLSPVSSFDEDGRFLSQIELPRKGSEVASSSQAVSTAQPPSNIQQPEVKVRPEPGHEETDSGPAVEEPDKPSWKKIPAEFVKDSAKVLFWEVIDELCKGIGEELKQEVDAKLHFSSDYLEGILVTTLKTEIRTLCEDTYGEAQEQKRKALHLEMELRRDRVAELLSDDLVNDLIHQESLNLATIEMREVKAQLRRECIERVTVDINNELVEEVMNEMVVDVSEDVFETDVRQRLKQLDDFEKLVKLSRAGRFWHKWKKEYKAVTKLKRAMEEFPCAPNMQSKKEQLKSLLHVDDERIVDKKFFVNRRAKLTIETPLEIEKRRKETETCALVHRLYRNLLHQTAWAPLDLGRLVGKELGRKARQSQQQNTLKAPPLFWKLLLCLPDVDDSSISSHSEAATHNLCKWLKVRFSKGPSTSSQLDVKGQVLSLYKCHLSDGFTCKRASLGVCVRTVEGQLEDDDIAAVEEDMLYLGTSALVFLLPAGAPLSKSNSVKYDQYWTTQHFRLKAILDVKPRYQGFPLVIVVPVPTNQSVSLMQIVRLLSLEEFLDEELLSDVELVTYELNENRPDGIDLTDPRVSEELCESIQWLAKKMKPVPSLTVQYFKDTVDLTLHQHYYTPVQHNHRKRKELGRLNKDPNSLLGLYNTVISHLSEVLTSDRLFKVSWPVSEFASKESTDLPPNHWNRGDHLEHLFSIVDSLRLPEFELDNPDSEDWFDVKRDLWKFVSSFAGSDYSGARIKLFSRLKSVIHKLEVDFEEACYFQYGEADCRPSFFNVPWSTVISLCIDYKLDSVDLVDPDAPNPQEKRELKVAYIKEEMVGFIPPESWKHIEADSAVLESPSLENTIKRAVYRAQEERNKSLTKTEISITEDPANVSVVAMDTKKTSSSLIKSLKSERRQSDHFQKYLEDALKDVDPDLDSSVTGSASFSVFETENQSFGAGNFSSSATPRRFSFDPMSNERRLSFDATTYFNQSQNDISAIFAPQNEGKLLLPPSRRKSDIGLQELSVLPGKKRRERLSEIYNNDKVMMYIKEPTVSEDVENFRENLRASRRESDLFEKKLRLMLQDKPETF